MGWLIEWWRATDRAWFLALNGDMGSLADSFFWTMSHTLTWVPLYVFIIWMLYRRLGWRRMLAACAMVILAVVVADQVANIFKYGVGKLRPTHNPALEGLVHTVRGYVGGKYGTVSAHAASSMAVALFTSLVFRRWWVWAVMFLWAAVVSYSRIYLGVHYPADILFGTVDGLFWAWLGYRCYLIIGKKLENK